MADIGKMTLHQLRIFWAVAHAESLTKASKLLGLTQPSLSQQISKLEKTIGTQLMRRGGNQFELTEAGTFLLKRAELILADVDETQAAIQQFAEGKRGSISVGALNSIARLVLPAAYNLVADKFAQLDIDIHEVSPWEAIDLLYGRRLHIALLARNSIAGTSLSFHQVDVMSDPYVLAVPAHMDLANVRDPDKDLPADERKVLNNCIQFSFGTQHTQRMAEWYRHVLPRHRVISQTRTYDMALSMVQAGVGVALVPALTALLGRDNPFAVKLYRTDLAARRIVALMPSQYTRAQPYAAFMDALQSAGDHVQLPDTQPIAPFLKVS